ncbi:MAG: signal peptide peptidase SppA, partial [Halioglobus sp.]|nr:signal peptide peptidase SppA [Halioglobus sp.]
MSETSTVRRVLRAIWNGITRIRMALSNLLFLVMLGLIYFVYVGGAPQPLPEKAALLLNMAGTVVEEKSPVDPLSAVLVQPTPADHEVLLRDVIESIELAAEDPAINELVMELDQLVYVGISRTQEIVRALEIFRASGKPIIASGDYFTQDQYLLASYADEIIIHPLGGVALEGFGAYQNYFSEALDKLSVNIHVFRVGENKGAVEPFLRNDMSPQEKRVTQRWLDDLWRQYTTQVESRRNLEPGTVDNYINNYADRLRAVNGDTSLAAQQAGFVDQLMTRSSSNDYLANIVGARNDDDLYEAIEFERYVSRKRPLSLSGPDGDRVAVITATGQILPGEQPPGSIGGDSLARLIRSTADEEGVKAIVLRVNSGGGSLFASEVIRQQLRYAQGKAIPLVVSMGGLAASGGYYIAAEADEIWATSSTITGSIGVFAAFPTFEDLLGRLGIYTDGVGTTDLAGALRVDRPLSPELVDALTSTIEYAYDSFIDIVATARGIPLHEMDALAQGRVWSATDALDLGLIDKVGGLGEAIDSAAALAGVSDYEVDYVGLPLSPRDMLLKQLANRVGSVA